MKAYPFNSKTVKMEGKFRVQTESKHKFTVATIYVTSDYGDCFLSSETGKGRVSINLNKINISLENSTHSQQRMQSSIISWTDMHRSLTDLES